LTTKYVVSAPMGAAAEKTMRRRRTWAGERWRERRVVARPSAAGPLALIKQTTAV